MCIILYSINIQRIEGIIMLLSFAFVDFYLFYDRTVDVQIWAILTRCQCRVSDTQVIDKAHVGLFL